MTKQIRKKIGKDQYLNLFSLVMVSSAFVVSVRNVPTMAETGLQMFFFGIASALFFFIPAALISAELATGWPENGGIYAWVRHAFGTRWGFFASWLQWSNMLLSVISMLYFVGGSFAFVFAPNLADSRLFLIVVLWIVVWLLTYSNLRGLKMTSIVSSTCFLSGVLFPAVLIVLLGIIYVLRGNPIQLIPPQMVSGYFPDIRHLATLVLILGFMRTFTGIEASANHANRVINPSKNFPIAILIVVILGLSINLFGALSVGAVVPKEKISLIAGLMEAFTIFFDQFHLKWFVPILGFLTAIGAMGGINAWLSGPVKGLWATAKDGDLPPFFQKANKLGVPTTLTISQGVLISVIGTAFLMMPSINIAFWVAVALSMMLYVTMYFLMMLAALYLRYKEPKVKRAYTIPLRKKNLGMWIVSIVGMACMVFSFFIALIPPAQLPTKNHRAYIFVILLSILIAFLIPILTGCFKKPSWQKNVEEEHD